MSIITIPNPTTPFEYILFNLRDLITKQEKKSSEGHHNESASQATIGTVISGTAVNFTSYIRKPLGGNTRSRTRARAAFSVTFFPGDVGAGSEAVRRSWAFGFFSIGIAVMPRGVAETHKTFTGNHWTDLGETFQAMSDDDILLKSLSCKTPFYNKAVIFLLSYYRYLERKSKDREKIIRSSAYFNQRLGQF